MTDGGSSSELWIIEEVRDRANRDFIYNNRAADMVIK